MSYKENDSNSGRLKHIFVTVRKTETPPIFICLSLYVGLTYTAYISVTMGLILMKCDENAGIFVRLIILKSKPIFKIFVAFFAKGQNSAAKGNDNFVVFRL